MAKGFLARTVTPAVKEMQEHYYGEAGNVPEMKDVSLRARETDFIASRDSFYMSTVGETGWPYMQHRGGPKGFLKTLAPDQLAFADFKGNRQLLTVGNTSANDRVCLFFMDYVNRTRLKILGHVEIFDAREHPDTVDELATPDTLDLVERIVKIRVVSFDWNCPYHITQRFDEIEAGGMIASLQKRVLELEAQVKRLKSQ